MYEFFAGLCAKRRKSGNNLFLIVFCLCWGMGIRISSATHVGVELPEKAKNWTHFTPGKEDRVWIQTGFPFNYSVSGIPQRYQNTIFWNNLPRIVGGVNAVRNEFPHMLALYTKNKENKRFEFKCGASIVNNNYALTAANCVFGVKVDNIKVVAGEHDRSTVEGTEIVRSISHVIIHDEYSDDENYYNDIAILRFREPLNFTKTIAPIMMADRFRKTRGQVAICGWGSTDEDEKTSLILQRATVRVIDMETCKKSYKTVDERQICAGYPNGMIDTCQGDYGGPLMQSSRSGRKTILVGIASYGNGCARPNYPGVFTNVGKFRDWIDPHIAQ